MVRAFILAVLVVGSVVPVYGGDEKQVDSLLASAADTSLSHSKRVGLMEKAVREDETGRAMHALSRYYLTQNSVLSRQFSKQWLRRAIKREPDNVDYQMTFAEIYWQAAQRDRFYKQVRKVISENPASVKALYWAGRHAAREMMYNLERETLKTGPARKKRFNYGAYGQSMRDQAIGYLTEVLSLDPEHRRARILLGQVYYEGHMPEELADLFQSYIAKHPEDWHAYFFMGLGLQEKQDLDSAFSSYSAGLDRMSETERQFMKSIVMLVDRKELQQTDDLPDDEALRRYWKGRDPLFLTPSNERLLEHCRRVAYANLRYGDPDSGAEGWATDRGQAYIRYGHPGSRNIYLDRANFVLLRETWSYPGFSITFERINEDRWNVLEVWMQGTVRSRYKDLLERIPEHYEDPYWLRQYDAPFQMAQFRDEDGKTRLELYYALPGEEVTHTKVGSGVQAVDLKQGLFLFDSHWNEVQETIQSLKKMPWIEGNIILEGYLFWGERLSLDPGTYHLAVEAEDRVAKTLGSFRDSLQIRRFGNEDLEMSGLLVAQRIVEQESRPFGRDRFMVLPNPLKQCQRDGHISFYFEIYNLSRDEFGSTNYQVTYQTRLLPESRGEGAPDPTWTTAVSNTFQESRPWEPNYLTLDMQGLTPGPWAFRVVAKDLRNGQEAMSSTVFRVMP
jgi:GWxTD domain-containing protein